MFTWCCALLVVATAVTCSSKSHTTKNIAPSPSAHHILQATQRPTFDFGNLQFLLNLYKAAAFSNPPDNTIGDNLLPSDDEDTFSVDLSFYENPNAVRKTRIGNASQPVETKYVSMDAVNSLDGKSGDYRVISDGTTARVEIPVLTARNTRDSKDGDDSSKGGKMDAALQNLIAIRNEINNILGIADSKTDDSSKSTDVKTVSAPMDTSMKVPSMVDLGLEMLTKGRKSPKRKNKTGMLESNFKEQRMMKVKEGIIVPHQDFLSNIGKGNNQNPVISEQILSLLVNGQKTARYLNAVERRARELLINYIDQLNKMRDLQTRHNKNNQDDDEDKPTRDKYADYHADILAKLNTFQKSLASQDTKTEKQSRVSNLLRKLIMQHNPIASLSPHSNSDQNSIDSDEQKSVEQITESPKTTITTTEKDDSSEEETSTEPTVNRTTTDSTEDSDEHETTTESSSNRTTTESSEDSDEHETTTESSSNRTTTESSEDSDEHETTTESSSNRTTTESSEDSDESETTTESISNKTTTESTEDSDSAEVTNTTQSSVNVTTTESTEDTSSDDDEEKTTTIVPNTTTSVPMTTETGKHTSPFLDRLMYLINFPQQTAVDAPNGQGPSANPADIIEPPRTKIEVVDSKPERCAKGMLMCIFQPFLP